MKLVSTKTELAALRGMCHKDKKIAAKILAGTDESYFYNEKSLDAYKKIRRAIITDGEPPYWRDLVEDPSLSEDTRDYLKNNSVKLGSEDEAVSTVRTLNKYRQARGLYLLSTGLMEKLQEKKVDVSNLLDYSSNLVTKLRMDRSLKDQALHIGKGNNSYDFVKNIIYNKEEHAYVPTGFRDFDEKNGGFFFGSFVTIGGSSGGGKSALASQLALNWARMGEKVVLVPLEMSKREMTGRILANMASIDVRKVLLQRLSTDEKELVINKYKKYVRKANSKEGRYTIFKPEQDMTIEEILPIASTYGPKIAIVDYISLLKGVSGEDQWQKLSAVARYCKVYAANHNMIVVMLAQVSEEGKIRYSQGIKEHSDYAWIFVSTKESRENEIINVEQLKGRNAELYPFSLRAQLNVMRIGDLSHEELEDLSKSKRKNKDKKSGGERKGKGEDYLDDISDAE